jgi:hypothetical protein
MSCLDLSLCLARALCVAPEEFWGKSALRDQAARPDHVVHHRPDHSRAKSIARDITRSSACERQDREQVTVCAAGARLPSISRSIR